MLRFVIWVAFAALLPVAVWIAVKNDVGAEKRLVGSGLVAVAAFLVWFVYSPGLAPLEERFPVLFPVDERRYPAAEPQGLVCGHAWSAALRPIALTVKRLREDGPGDAETGYWKEYIPWTHGAVQVDGEFDSEMWAELMVFCVLDRIAKKSQPHLRTLRVGVDGAGTTEPYRSLRELDTATMTLRELRLRSDSRLWRSLHAADGSGEMHYPSGMDISVSTKGEAGPVIRFESSYSRGEIRIQQSLTLLGAVTRIDVSCEATFEDAYKMSKRAAAEREWFQEVFASLSPD